MHGTMRLFLAFGVLGTTMSTEFVQMGSGPWGYGYNDCKVACASYSDSTSLAPEFSTFDKHRRACGLIDYEDGA